MNEYLNKSNQNLVDYQSCPAVRRTAYLNFCSCCIFNNTLIHNFNVSFANGLSACENVLVQRVLQFNLYCALCHSCHFSLFFCFLYGKFSFILFVCVLFVYGPCSLIQNKWNEWNGIFKGHSLDYINSRIQKRGCRSQITDLPRWLKGTAEFLW